MGFNDTFRMSSHAVITNEKNELLQLKATYGSLGWGLPGGALDPGESIFDALHRECFEEIGVKVHLVALTGSYYHSTLNSHAFIFRCTMPDNANIILSEEHSEFRYFPLDELNPVQRERVDHCLNFSGDVRSGCY